MPTMTIPLRWFHSILLLVIMTNVVCVCGVDTIIIDDDDIDDGIDGWLNPGVLLMLTLTIDHYSIGPLLTSDMTIGNMTPLTFISIITCYYYFGTIIFDRNMIICQKVITLTLHSMLKWLPLMKWREFHQQYWRDDDPNHWWPVIVIPLLVLTRKVVFHFYW